MCYAYGVGERQIEGEVAVKTVVDFIWVRMPEWVARIMWES